MTSGFSFKRSGLYSLAGGSERKQPINEHFADSNKIPEKGSDAMILGLAAAFEQPLGEPGRLGGIQRRLSGRNQDFKVDKGSQSKTASKAAQSGRQQPKGAGRWDRKSGS